MTDEQFRQLAERMGQMEVRLTSRMEGMEGRMGSMQATLDKVKNDTTVIKGDYSPV